MDYIFKYINIPESMLWNYVMYNIYKPMVLHIIHPNKTNMYMFSYSR